MTQADQVAHEWTGRTVHGHDGVKLGKLTEVVDRGADGRGTWGVVRSPFGRRKLVPLDGAAAGDGGVLTVPVDRASLRSAPRAAAAAPDAETGTALQNHYHGRRVLADAQLRQHERFGGTKVGAAFFGWLVAVGLTVLLAGVAGAIGAVVGAADLAPAPTPADATSVGLTSAVLALAVLVVAYFAGGYVAGRLARFDGARNGFLAWLIGALVTLAAAVAVAVAGAEYNLFRLVQLPAVPVTAEQLTVGGLLTLAAVALGTLVAAVLGGAAGQRYHHRVDRVGVDAI
jgi:hypothetical protein